MFQKIINTLVLILFNQFIDAKHVHYSEPDLTNPYIPKELLESCGYRYRVLHYNIRHHENCFANNTYGDRVVTLPQTEFLRIRRQPSNRIYKGRRVQFREAPWVVQIVVRGYTWYGKLIFINHHCTGVLITMKYILTAAHCYHEGIRATVYAGSDETTQGWRTDDIVWYQHPNFISETLPNGTHIYNHDFDIGIIELKTPIDWQKYGTGNGEEYLINTICLPLPENFSDPDLIDNDYQKATIFGWGKVIGHTYPRFLQRGDVFISYIPKGSVQKFVSYAPSNETRACLGDSGSGLIQYIDRFETRAVLIGIQSQMEYKRETKDTPCYIRNIGGLIANRVVYHLNWINQYLRKN